ncbi:MAG: prenyltransferase/squalene oxidase repeat-containing protein [Desulfobulbaceae bacterium]|nr:prenyltransferase/squalene oxidase repeat-containing protein [Desulfobulbaceae bacterium]
MEADGKLRDILTAAVPFVLSRRKETGGFAATPTLPATIEDTFHALNILDLARQYGAEEEKGFDPSADENLRSYLDGCRRSLPVGARITFQLLWCCRIAGLTLAAEAVESVVIDRMRTADSLDDWYYCARILSELLAQKLPIFSGERNLAAVLDRDWLGVDEAWMHMYLCRMSRNTLPPAPKLISWFRATQNGDGGFGFFPGTTSFIENCHYCLRALNALEAEPANPETARRFITACQTASGGFGRGLRAAPFLDATWHAVAALVLLECGRKIHR